MTVAREHSPNLFSFVIVVHCWLRKCYYPTNIIIAKDICLSFTGIRLNLYLCFLYKKADHHTKTSYSETKHLNIIMMHLHIDYRTGTTTWFMFKYIITRVTFSTKTGESFFIIHIDCNWREKSEIIIILLKVIVMRAARECKLVKCETTSVPVIIIINWSWAIASTQWYTYL